MPPTTQQPSGTFGGLAQGKIQPGSGGGWNPVKLVGKALNRGVNSLGDLAKKKQAGMPHYEDDRGWMEDYLKTMGQNPFMNRNSPYEGDYGKLISQLQSRANGEGESQAGLAFQNANNQNMNQAAALAGGSRSAGAARQAQTNIQQMGQGAAHGYAAARANEMAQATGQLGNAIAGADAAKFQRDRANQMSWLQLLAEQMGLSKSQMQASIANSQQPSALEQAGAVMQSGGAGGAKLWGTKK